MFKLNYFLENKKRKNVLLFLPKKSSSTWIPHEESSLYPHAAEHPPTYTALRQYFSTVVFVGLVINFAKIMGITLDDKRAAERARFTRPFRARLFPASSRTSRRAAQWFNQAWTRAPLRQSDSFIVLGRRWRNMKLNGCTVLGGIPLPGFAPVD